MIRHADSKDSEQTDWVDAQAVMSLRWAQGHFISFVMHQVSLLVLSVYLKLILRYYTVSEISKFHCCNL